MRVRILYTNGTKTNDAFWLTHDGKNVHLGNPGVDQKISYHELGQLHVKSKGQKLEELKHIPLAKLVGEYNILTSLFPNSERGAGDQVVCRQVCKDATPSLTVGLLPCSGS